MTLPPWRDGNDRLHEMTCAGSVSGTCPGCAEPPDDDPPDNGGGNGTVQRLPTMAVAVRLSEVAPERVTWLWPGRLPVGKLVTLDGDPSLGKSTLAVTFAAHVSTGTPWPDATTCPLGDVVVLSAEDGLADTIRPRLDAAGGDPTRVHALTAVRTATEDGEPATRPPTLADVGVIRGLLEQHRARLLVVDVLMAYLPGRVDSHRDQDIRTVLHRVAELAEATGCTVLLLRHLNKTGAGSPLYRGGGSIGIVGAARAGLLVAPDPDDEKVRVLAAVKSNLAELPASLSYQLEPAPGSHVARVAWIGESAHPATALLRAAESDDERSERDEAAEWLLDYLRDQGGAAPAADALKAAARDGFAKTTLHKARKRAGVTTTKGGIRSGWTWRHPADTTPKIPQGSQDSGSQDREPSEPSRNLRAVPPPEEAREWSSTDKHGRKVTTTYRAAGWPRNEGRQEGNEPCRSVLARMHAGRPICNALAVWRVVRQDNRRNGTVSIGYYCDEDLHSEAPVTEHQPDRGDPQ